MFTDRPTIHRRDFLGTLLTASAAVGLSGLAPGVLSAATQEQSASSASAGFEDWLGKIKAKHRQVFDSPEHVGGLPFVWARVFLMTNQQANGKMQAGASDSDAQAVMVLRHNAIPLAMDSKVWKKYNFTQVFDIKDAFTKKPMSMNAFWEPKEGSLPMPGMSINEHLSSGTLIGVCDMAITVFSKTVAEKMKLNPDDVKKEWEAAVLPGIQIVPSGVLAVNRAQEHGCTYCFAG